MTPEGQPPLLFGGATVLRAYDARIARLEREREERGAEAQTAYSRLASEVGVATQTLVDQALGSQGESFRYGPPKPEERVVFNVELVALVAWEARQAQRELERADDKLTQARRERAAYEHTETDPVPLSDADAKALMIELEETQ